MTPKPPVSLTSTETFAARAQRSEARRVSLWLGALAAVLALTVLRRALGGQVMSVNAVFWPTVAVLTAAIAAQIFLLRLLNRFNRLSRLLPSWVWRASGAVDLLVPMAQLAIVAWFSPR